MIFSIFFFFFLVGGEYILPEIPPEYWYFEPFQGNPEPWISSRFEYPDETQKYRGKVKISPALGSVISDIEDTGLLLPKAAEYYGLCTPIVPPMENGKKDMILQYEVKYESELTCGGVYLKLLQPMKDYSLLNENSPYHVLFGPDFCGNTNAVKFVLNHKNPLTGEWEEKTLIDPPRIRNDPFTHLYALKITPANDYEIRIDTEVVREGSLFDDLTPSVLPPKMIDDPSQPKPNDWEDEELTDDPVAPKPDFWDENEPMYINDPSDKIPQGWNVDEPLFIPDPTHSQPDNWDEEEDGPFTPSLINNPACSVGCGEWKPRTIPNPNYRGRWSVEKVHNPSFKGDYEPDQIENPDFFIDENAYVLSGGVGGVGIEVWTMTPNILFDNIIVTWNEEVIEIMQDLWRRKHLLEVENSPFYADYWNILGSEISGVISMFLQLSDLIFRPIPLVITSIIILLLCSVLLIACCCFCRKKKSTKSPEPEENIEVVDDEYEDIREEDKESEKEDLERLVMGTELEEEEEEREEEEEEEVVVAMGDGVDEDLKDEDLHDDENDEDLKYFQNSEEEEDSLEMDQNF